MATEFTSRPPDYNLAVLDKKTEAKANCGVAWNQPDGSIRIKLNGFVVLDTSRMDLVITLFKTDRPWKGRKDTAMVKAATEAAYDDQQPPPY